MSNLLEQRKSQLAKSSAHLPDLMQGLIPIHASGPSLHPPMYCPLIQPVHITLRSCQGGMDATVPDGTEVLPVISIKSVLCWAVLSTCNITRCEQVAEQGSALHVPPRVRCQQLAVQKLHP